jgi:putative DNA methylase
MIQIPQHFFECAPVGPGPEDKLGALFGRNSPWINASGLAEDVRRYGSWMSKQAREKIGHLYPKATVSMSMTETRPDLKPLVGQEMTAIASLWSRTVICPNPACGCQMPLLSSFILSNKVGKECYLHPFVEGGRVYFRLGNFPPSNVRSPSEGYKRGVSGIFECASCGTVTTRDYVAKQAMEIGLGAIQTAVVVESDRGRVYLPAEACPLRVAIPVVDDATLEVALAPNPRDVWCRNFGLLRQRDLFSPRQLYTVSIFSDLVAETRRKIYDDAIAAGMFGDGQSLASGGVGALAYSEAISVYLACALSRLASYNNTICHWNVKGGSVGGIFSRHSIPMSWDYIEVHPLEKMSGNWDGGIDWVADVVDQFVAGKTGHAQQADARFQDISFGKVISTDPPYYDNIGYADLSDFFYVWLRRSLRTVYPDLFTTIAVPKVEELVALPYRHGSKQKAEDYFVNGMTHVMNRLADQSHPAFPVTIYYAFKQSETKSVSGTSSSGWETFLEAVYSAGFCVVGTWPMRTEKEGRTIQNGFNALASSIILVCRKRANDAQTTSRREFIRELNGVLPEALDEMTKGSGDERSPVAPVDLSQAIIGPGMAVFSKYAAVLEADGSPMSVRTALQLINRFLAEDDFDADTQFCLHWFEQHGWAESIFGEADVLARSKSTSVDAMKEAGVLQSGSGKVRLLKWAEYPTDWDPRTDARTPVWEALHQLVRALKQGGEAASGALLAALGGKAEAVRQLAYRLYTLCERLGQAEDARAYNELITSWTGIEAVAASVPKPVESQGALFEN